jgi:hypothetical protein
MHPRLPLSVVVVTALAATVLAGCGDGDGSAARPDPEARTSLTIAVEGPTASRAFTLACDPAGGSWPDVDGACARLATPAGRAVLDPIGIETRDLVPVAPVDITVSGRVDGEDVRLTIPREGSGTRRARYRELVSLLGREPMLEVIEELGG